MGRPLAGVASSNAAAVLQFRGPLPARTLPRGQRRHPPGSNPMIVYIAADLLWSTRIQSTAKGLGVPCRPVRTLDMLRARLADSPITAAIVDLDAGEVTLEIIRALRAAPVPEGSPAVRIVAFGPHIATELFEQARRAGADTVLARGAL